MPVWLSPLLGFLQPVLDKFFPDKTKQAEFAFELQKLAASQAATELDDAFKLAQDQVQVDDDEAKSSNLFVSGWRPAIGWICGCAFGYNFILQPLLSWVSSIVKIPVPPQLDLSEMTPVLLGMLGLGALHSYDRVKGTIPEEGK